jgi:hypothetical protein
MCSDGFVAGKIDGGRLGDIGVGARIVVVCIDSVDRQPSAADSEMS